MAIGVTVRYKEGEKTPTRTFSSNQEKQVAKTLNAKQTPNSGATAWQKGDIITNDSGEASFLIECKTKTKSSQSISIKKEWFEKNKQDAVFMGKKHSAIVFNFGPDEDNHYIIDEYLFKELLQHLEGKI